MAGIWQCQLCGLDLSVGVSCIPDLRRGVVPFGRESGIGANSAACRDCGVQTGGVGESPPTSAGQRRSSHVTPCCRMYIVRVLMIQSPSVGSKPVVGGEADVVRVGDAGSLALSLKPASGHTPRPVLARHCPPAWACRSTAPV